MTAKRKADRVRMVEPQIAAYAPSTPEDPRLLLSAEERGATLTTLPNGTVLTSFDDQPLPPVLAADPDPAPPPMTWRADRPKPHR